MPDAIVIGAGPNGLVAANVLADAGWDVVVLEAESIAGGAVRTSELTGEPGFRHDWFSAFYPLAVSSPAQQQDWSTIMLAYNHSTPFGGVSM